MTSHPRRFWMKVVSCLLSATLFTTSLVPVSFVSASENARKARTSTHRELGESLRTDDRKHDQKIAALRNSVKDRSRGYRLFIRSSDGLDAVRDELAKHGSGVSVKKMGNGLLEIRSDAGTDFARGFLSDVDAGRIPETLAGKYEVVQPKAIESFDSDTYLAGEDQDKLAIMRSIGADKYQEHLSTKSRLRVAVIDSGMNTDHEDLTANTDRAGGYDFVESDAIPQDDSGHGTHVSGIIAASVNGKGVYWVDSNAELIPLKVLDANGVGSSYDLISAIAKAVDSGAKVINISLGTSGDPATDPICQAVSDAKNSWVIVVAAAGNGNTDVSWIVPAGCSDALAVGSIGSDGKKADFSNYGAKVDVYAPWVDVWSTKSDGMYEQRSGTSVSAPLVAGAVAAYLSENPLKTPDEVRTAIRAVGGSFRMDSLMDGVPAGVSFEQTWNVSKEPISGSWANFDALVFGTWAYSLELAPVQPQDPGLYYSGSFLYNGLWYGNSYYTGVLFPEKTLDTFGVKVMDKKPDDPIWTISAMSAPSNGLVGEWLLNGNANDTSGNNRNWVGYNLAYTWTTVAGWWQAALFNGTGSYILLPDVLNTSQPFSFSFLVKATKIAWVSCALTQWDDPLLPKAAFQMQIVDSNYRFVTSTSTSVVIASAPWSSYQNEFVHVYGEYNGSVINMYVNNVLVTSLSSGAPMNVGTSFLIWARYWFGNVLDFFTWEMRNVRIYNRTLTGNERQELYSELFAANTSTTTPIFTFTGSLLSTYAGSTWKVVTRNEVRIASSNGSESSGYVGKLQSIRDGAKNLVVDVSDPVSLSTGEFTYENTFMKIPGIGIPYEFTLNYRNRFTYDGPVGHNFDHNYNMYLVENPDGSVNYYNGRLGVFHFPVSGSAYEYNPGLKANLTKNAGGVYMITYDDGMLLTFGSNLKVATMADRYGNDLSFSYNANSQLTSVVDTLERSISYAYNTETRLQSVTDWNGESVTLAYYGASETGGMSGDLKSVTISANGASKSASFTYGSVHDILTLKDSKGQTYVVNTYDGNGRVTNQLYGSGSTSYSYVLMDGRVSTNTVTNANAVQTRYTFDANWNTTKREIYDTVWGGKTEYNYEYDTQARLVKTIYPRGNGVKYAYDSRGNIISKREKTDISAADSTDDLITTYTYDGTYDVRTSESFPSGLAKTYTLDNKGNVISESISGIANPDGTTYSVTSAFEHDSLGQRVRAINPEGWETVFAYGSGQLIQTTEWTGSLLITKSYAYDDYGALVSATDGEGHIKTFSTTPFHMTATGTTAEWIQYHSWYDANNNLIREETRTASGEVARSILHTYDVLDREVSRAEYINTTDTRITLTTYDGNGNILTTKAGSGALTRFAYDEMNRVKTKRIEVDPNDSTKDIVTTFAYDRNGNLVSSTDPLGNATTFTYNLFDRMTRKTDPTGAYIGYSYDGGGKVIEERVYDSSDTLLAKTGYVYDTLGHLIKVTKYDLTGSPTHHIVTTTEYDRAGNVKKQKDGAGNITTNSYDVLGRVTNTTDPLGNTVSLAYDGRSLVTQKTIASSGSTYGTSTSYAYDGDGRLITETDANNKTKTRTYDANGNVLALKTEDDRTTTYAYDRLGELLTETKTLSGVQVTTTYGYDRDGNLTSLTDANGNITFSAYDNLRRKISETLPDGEVTSYTYDKAGHTITVTDPNGTVLTNTYDALGRLTGRNMNTGTGVVGTTEVAYGYDPLGRLITATNTGTLSTNETFANELGFVYDSQGRLMQEVQDGTVIYYAYDDNGNRTSVRSGTGYLAEYSYDALGRLLDAKYNSGSIATYSYSGILLAGIGYGNGVNTNYSYDPLLRLSGITNTNGSGTFLSRAYGYDPVGNVLGDGERNYAYDSLSRLTGVGVGSGALVPLGGESFVYDPMGNRLESVVVSDAGTRSRSYSGNILNQYLSTTSSGITDSYTYDPNGNLISNGTYLFSYDSDNRLVEVRKASDNTFIAGYIYDPLGRRIRTLTQDSNTSYTYSGENAIQETKESGGSGAHGSGTGSAIRLTSKIYGNTIDDLLAYETDDTILSDSDFPEHSFCESRVIPYNDEFAKYGHTGVLTRCAELWNQYTSTTKKLFFVTKDHAGSTLALTDGSGNLIQQYSYDVFGAPYVKGYTQSGSGTGVVSVVSFIALNDFQGNLHGNHTFFTGREYETELWLYFYRARFYDPKNARFLQRDPIGTTDQVNLYTYVGNNPVRYTDPSGKVIKNAAKETYNRWVAWATAIGTAVAMWAAGIVDEDLYHGSSFLGNSILGTTDLVYYEWSDYVKALKRTDDYKKLKDEIAAKVRGWSLNFSSSTNSSDTLTLLTLWKYNYTVTASESDWNYDVRIILKDVYDFNSAEADGTILNSYLNTMHDANTYWVLQPIRVQININERIPWR